MTDKKWQLQSIFYTASICFYRIAAEQKARTTYDNILRLVHDSDVCDPIRFLRAREVVHFQRFGEANREDCSKFGTHKIQSLRRIPTRPSKLGTSAFAPKERTCLDFCRACVPAR